MGDQMPVTTIPPFADTNKLPACAVGCDALYAANGGCVPPAVATTDASVYTDCFCANARVAALSTGNAGVCDTACTADSDLSSIQGWFQSLCNVDPAANDGGNDGNGNGNGQATSSTTSSADSSLQTGTYRKNPENHGDWLSNHWQWVIMIVILVVAIAGIWIGACIWRRRYLRKKDRQNSLGQKHSGSTSRPSWGPGMDAPTPDSAPAGYDTNAYDAERNQGVMGPGAIAMEEKPKKSKARKWLVKDRT